jgi:hypothetical protein
MGIAIGSGLDCMSIKPPNAKIPPMKDEATNATNNFFLAILLIINFKFKGKNYTILPPNVKNRSTDLLLNMI